MLQQSLPSGADPKRFAVPYLLEASLKKRSETVKEKTIPINALERMLCYEMKC